MTKSQFLIKIAIPVVPNLDGFPPIAHEWVWAASVGENKACIDNVTFFSQWTYGDIVRIVDIDGSPRGVELLVPGGNFNQLFHCKDAGTIQRFRKWLKDRGVLSEGWPQKSLISASFNRKKQVHIALSCINEFGDKSVSKFNWNV